VSYDGAGEPLGRSQVVAYLERLARSCDITLISFEKDDSNRVDTDCVLREAGITWLPLRYHKRPAVLSTIRDVIAGARALRRACRTARADIVHVRSYVPALMALLSQWPRGRAWKLLFDIRGFWPEERVEGGLWPPGGALYRVTKRSERWFFSEADAVVTLAAASVPAIRALLGGRVIPIVVIPTCAEVERFSHSEARADGPRAVWCGSLGTFYRFDLAVRLTDALKMPMTVLTRETDRARADLGARAADVRAVSPQAVADELHPGDVGLCCYVDGTANLARAPTRFAEYLAAGMVVAATPEIGDVDLIVRNDRLGVVIEDESDAGLMKVAHALRQMAADGETRERARRRAVELFSVDRGVAMYLRLYRVLLGEEHEATESPASERRPAERVNG
jgi:glycosyltransferase involved in cell wall biosynthesis